MKPRGLMILHKFRPGPVGGAELQAERLAGRLAALGHEMQVLTWRTVPDAPLEEKNNGVTVHRLASPLPYRLTRDNAPTFRFLVRNRATYDLLHAHQAFGHAVAAVVAARCLRKKCLVKIACTGQYGDLRTFSAFRGFSLALRILHQADAVVAVSSEVREELLQYGFPGQRIVRIPNGVDVAHFKRSWPFPKRDPTRFILICRRHPQKGIDTTLQAARMLKEQGLAGRFEIHMYGADYPECDYRAMARELGVAEVVNFHSFEKDILSVYHTAHCFVLPSRGEGLSNSLLEAMAMELPAIATSVSGTPDVIDDGVDGVLIPPDAPDRLAAGMAEAIANPQVSHRMGCNARRKAEECFSLESVARRYSQLYEQLHSAK